MYGICKVYRDFVDNCPPFRPFLPELIVQTKNFSNDFEIFDYQRVYCEELICFYGGGLKQDVQFFMESLVVGLLFTNILLEENANLNFN